jgi:hypothetical protein
VPSRLWAKWKRFAHRAAEIQSIVLLSILYWLVVAPVALFRRKRPPDAPRWTKRPPTGVVTLETARRQY